MPRVFEISGYLIYIWSNEGRPLEPIHFHITDGDPGPGNTKVWVTKSGKCLLCHNNSNIPKHKLNILMRIVESRISEVIQKWQETFDEVNYYC